MARGLVGAVAAVEGLGAQPDLGAVRFRIAESVTAN